MNNKHSLKSDFATAIRGFFMGTADVVPGVSGGTVALIGGIYPRLINAVSCFDRQLIGMLKRREWQRAMEHVDFRFLFLLAIGIGSGIVLTASLVSSLLSSDQTRPFALATFFGMILASGIVVVRALKVDKLSQVVRYSLVALVGGALAAWLTTQSPPLSEAGPSMPYLFLCGAIAICAMILPGISGALILLILGVYGHLTAIPHQLKEGQELFKSGLSLIVFAAGCATGLLSFSKLLKWFLEHHYQMTMAFLCGLMFGSLPKLWPFQKNVTPEIEEFKHQRFEIIWPEMDSATMAVYGVATLAAVMVLTVTFLVEKSSHHEIDDAASA